MPKYQYRCKDCDTHKEVERSITSTEEPVVCPECNKFMGRTYTSPVVQFRGRGFYSTGG